MNLLIPHRGISGLEHVPCRPDALWSHQEVVKLWMTTFFSASLQGHEDLGMPNFSMRAWTFRVVLQQRVLRQLLIFCAYSCVSSSFWPPLSTQPHSLLGRYHSFLKYAKLTFRLMGRLPRKIHMNAFNIWVRGICRQTPCLCDLMEKRLCLAALDWQRSSALPTICLNSSLPSPLLPRTNTKV